MTKLPKIQYRIRKVDESGRPYRLEKVLGRNRVVKTLYLKTQRDAREELQKLTMTVRPGRVKIPAPLLREAAKDIRDAKMRLRSPSWIRQASEMSLDHATELATSTPKAEAFKTLRYLKLRQGIDVSAKIRLQQLAGHGPRYGGYVVTRKLYDKGKLKPFAFYPRKVSGLPPYFSKTKAGAKRQLERARKLHEGEKLQVSRLTKRVYLNRY